jgi:methylmalonyl-CoA/ethylmalonyl-CoA epimerase
LAEKLWHPTHVGIAVKSAKATSDFLSSMWGIGPWQTMDYPSPKEQMIFGEPFVLKIMYASIGITTLELLEPVNSPKSVWAQFIAKKGEGLHHVAFSLKDFDKRIKALQAKGSKMLVHAVVKGGDFDGKQWCYMQMEPGGFVVELMDDFSL